MLNKNPIRVMFVDDEVKMRKLLAICIDWKSLDYEVVADASGSNHALELIPIEKPDVIITDIEMPFINGLDFAQMVLEEYPHIKIVILTAHNVFDYAKQGLEIGVSSFLLKPVKREELTNKMLELHDTLREEQHELYEHKLLKKKLEENRQYIIQNYLSNMMMISISEDTLWENLQYYQIPLHRSSGYYNILLIMPVTSLDVEENNLQHLQCKELLYSIVKRMPGVILFQDLHQNLIILSENRKINLYTYGSHFSSLVQDKLELKAYTGIGTPVSSLENIHFSYQQAYQNAQLAKYSHNKSFLANSQPNKKSGHSRLQDLIESITEELPLYLQVPLEEETLSLVEKSYDTLEAMEGSALSDMMVLSLSIINIILTTLSDKGISYHEIYNTDHLPYTHILELKDSKSLLKYITQLVSFTLHQLELYTHAKGNKLIHTIIQYINENIEQSTLTLKKIAEMNYINPSYLSRTFKEVTNMNFMDYLTSMRIEKAKKMLQNSNLRVYEIAEAVGITDPNYFSKFFKKHTNYTPAQYKENAQSGQQTNRENINDGI